MLLVAKTSLISRCMGFVRDGGALGAEKKKALAPPPHFTLYKTKGLKRRGSSQPPLPTAWETFSSSLFLGSFPTLASSN